MKSSKDPLIPSKSSPKNRNRCIVIGVLFCVIGAAIGIILWQVLPHKRTPTHQCDVAILGAGFAGTYAAYQLTKQTGLSVCLVEAASYVGGRVFDVSESPMGPLFGVGALRVTAPQVTMLSLAKELNISLQQEEFDKEYVKVRGRYYFRDISHNGSDDTIICKEAFPTLSCAEVDGRDAYATMFMKLLKDYHANKSIAYDYPDWPNYILAQYGDEGLAFLRSITRYNSLMTSVSIHSVLDFLTNELAAMGLDPTRLYPEGGMSQFVSKMMLQIDRGQAHVLMNSQVTSINMDDDNQPFEIITSQHVIRATKVLCAIEPRSLREIQGNVVDSFRSAPEFSSILPKSLAIVTAWWDRRWWEDLEQNISRVLSHESCFSVMDIPAFPYGREQNVTRVVYDDGVCVDTWRSLEARNDSNALLMKTISMSLENMFPNYSIPEPRHLHIKVWPTAWHFQQANSTVTNERIANWSLSPIPGKNFFLIGEAFNLDWNAWCDGAMKSAMWALYTHFGFQFPCLHDEGSPANCSGISSPAKSSSLFKTLNFMH